MTTERIQLHSGLGRQLLLFVSAWFWFFVADIPVVWALSLYQHHFGPACLIMPLYTIGIFYLSRWARRNATGVFATEAGLELTRGSRTIPWRLVEKAEYLAFFSSLIPVYRITFRNDLAPLTFYACEDVERVVSRAFLHNQPALPADEWSRERAACGCRSDQILSGVERMPEPIQSVGTNMCQFDDSYDVSGAPPPTSAPATHAAPPAQSAEPAPSARAVKQLVSASSAATPPAAHCVDQAADVFRTGGQMLAAGAAVLVSAPSVLGLAVTGAAYLGLSAAFGSSVAKLENCEADATAKSKAQ